MGIRFLGTICHGTEFDGEILSGGIDFMGIACLGGQEVGNQNS